MKTGRAGNSQEHVEEIFDTEGALDFQITLEKRISRIYEKIADQFSSGSDNDKKWGALWRELAGDEADHASFLAIEKTFLRSGVRFKKTVEVDPEVQKELDSLLSRCEEQVNKEITEKDAIQILSTLEASEVNEIFSSLLTATNSQVLSHLTRFSQAHRAHEGRIQEVIRKYRHHLSPSDL